VINEDIPVHLQDLSLLEQILKQKDVFLQDFVILTLFCEKITLNKRDYNLYVVVNAIVEC
jgi:hypothetical protein